MHTNGLDKSRKAKIKRAVPLLLSWFSQNARDLPWRRRRDPYAIWVSEIMLQQTQVKTVVPYWERWMRALPTLEAMAKARSQTLHKLWEGLGYYTRVRNLQKAARFVVKEHRGKFPERFDQVLALPGIGRYTAGAVCSIAFNQPTPVLDGNVIRVLARLFGIIENPREKRTNALLWELAEALVTRAVDSDIAPAVRPKDVCSVAAVSRCIARSDARLGVLQQSEVRASSRRLLRPEGPADFKKERSAGDERNFPPRASYLNQSLMELGALICTPRQPKCELCPVVRSCVAYRQNWVERLPNLTPKNASIARRFAAFVVECDGHFLVQQRPDGVVNARLWEFPNTELDRDDEPALKVAARSLLGFAPRKIRPLGTIKHSITRYRITVSVFALKVTKDFSVRPANGRWLRRCELNRLSFPSAHRKISNLLDELSFDF